ncbi:uncharacterized protein Z519_07028 [Cladophialophora bantiana CBS 173.52]|uniref:Uncharacterized protein n=1 Tax=Cladophialophora bantiana (strain ATCC 10958 / CBS 173.52 / CDC B-1940 / NIH 8579) TaxID=1442370 RepID=A0A0D2EQ43_CLAB1|nr:uncharacterized protein Z519_07028 [Cladophialophora bantiana CBS 173.52]KIW92046.1 hypothetical protein Z519_07028 [Cladophialophora bantiana CBS 173.52]
MASSHMISPFGASLTVGGKQLQAMVMQQQAPMAAFFIHSLDHPQGRIFHVVKPEDISFAPPVLIRRPPLPEPRQISLQMVIPCIFFVQYPCRQKCRSLGICIHYQFVVGCRTCPDGLRCPICVQQNVEQAIQAGRKCPLHQNPAQPSPINNRPEDFLATVAQREVCDEVLRRSFTCQWDDIPGLPKRRPEQGGWEVARSDFHRETTPRDMRDLRMLESLYEDGLKSEENPSQTKGSGVAAGFNGPLGIQVTMPQGFLGQHMYS